MLNDLVQFHSDIKQLSVANLLSNERKFLFLISFSSTQNWVNLEGLPNYLQPLIKALWLCSSSWAVYFGVRMSWNTTLYVAFRIPPLPEQLYISHAEHIIFFSIFQSIEARDYVQLAIAFTRSCMFMPIFFLICNMGEMVTSSFLELDETVYGLVWYHLPVELQRYVPIMLMSIQRPVIMKGVFALDCSRDTFKQVIV